MPKNARTDAEPHLTERFLGTLEVRHRYGGVTRETLRRWTRDERVGFPAPLKLGAGTGLNHWRLSELIDWERRRTAQRSQ